MDKRKWVIDDEFELSQEPMSIKGIRKVRERHKKYGVEDGITDEEFEKIINNMKDNN